MLIYGIHPVEELVSTSAESVTAIYVDSPGASKFDDLERLADENGLRLEHRPTAELDSMAEGGNHQGVVARTRTFRYVSVDDLVDATSEASTACIVILDQVQDPQNLGAILRSVAALGADGVVIPKNRAASVTPTVVRASAGEAFRVPIAKVTNLSRTLARLKEEGYWAVGAGDEDNTEDLWDVDFVMKTALVMGGEGPGIRRLVWENCDLHARIPMSSAVESLNVSVATALFLYEIQRQISGA